MKKWIVLSAALVLVANVAWAARTRAAVATPVPTAVATPVVSDDSLTVAQRQIDTMTPGFAYNFSMDVSLIDMYNTTFATANETGSWYYYPVYRAILSDVFQNGMGVTADIEKPGYASGDYPTLKVNELYGKYKTGDFYFKVGRQVFGDKDDLLLGLQADAVDFGWYLSGTDLDFFYAHTDVLSPWGETMTGTMGFVPVFTFTPTMGLRGYLLIETAASTVNNTDGTTSDHTNILSLIGAKYYMKLAGLDLGAELGIQFPSAEDTTGADYKATSEGVKLDAAYTHGNNNFGFNVGGHLVYTGGASSDGTNLGFVSPNQLVGSGPGLFNKIQDGAGAYTWVDSLHAGNEKLNQYDGLFAFGLDANFDILGKMLQPGVALWFYGDNNGMNNVKSGYIGTEFDETLTYNMNKNISFYELFGYMMPNASYTVPSAQATNPNYNPAMKFVLGTKLAF
jgi:hypothetical protein